MADDEPAEESEEPSFRERLEQAREEAGEPGEGADDLGAFGGGMGGNPFAQMMGGMMGGGPGGRMQEEARETAVAREVAQLREELAAVNENLERIADALED